MVRAESNPAVALGLKPQSTKETAAAYLRAFESLLHQIDLDAIDRVVRRLQGARDRGATIYVAGNGGSAATASHFVNDLGKFARASGRPLIRAISLTDNTSWLTALANDEGYERAFAGQLENFARPGDVLIVISASGNSPNLIRAVELAAATGVTSIALLGFDGGRLLHMADECLWLPTELGACGKAEDGHSLLCHVIATCLVHGEPQLRS